MEREYGRAGQANIGRVVIGGSASLIRDGEMSREERRRREAAVGNLDKRYVEKLCERYRDRGIASHVHADAAQQEKNEALTRAMAPGAYIMTEQLSSKMGSGIGENKYRSGQSDGKRYMTVDDFSRYYHDQRGYKMPQFRHRSSYTVQDELAVASSDVSPREATLPKKDGWLTDTDKLPTVVQKLFKYSWVQRLNVWAGETFPREKNMEISTAKRRALPAAVLASLVTVAVSMTMIVGSTVLVSRSQMEVSQLRQELADKKEVSGELSDKLDLKNDMLNIRDIAVNELGMVGEEYLSGNYVKVDKDDSIEVYEKEEKQESGLSALLSAMGFGN